MVYLYRFHLNFFTLTSQLHLSCEIISLGKEIQEYFYEKKKNSSSYQFGKKRMCVRTHIKIRFIYTRDFAPHYTYDS